MSRILYKYLDINGGKAMMGLLESRCIFRKKKCHPTLQFTNATQLNDPFDCHPKLIDYSNVPDEITHSIFTKEWWQKKVENDALNLRNCTWLTSFSKENESILMWAHYCNNHTGLCVGLDVEKIPPMHGLIYPEALEIEVQYPNILDRPNIFSNRDLAYYQLGTKAKEWAYENEVRLVIPEPSPRYAAFTPAQAKTKMKIWDWKEIRHYLPLEGDCFESIYFGVKIDPVEKDKIINLARTKLNPNIKLYQMQVDENAFRLNAKEITD